MLHSGPTPLGSLRTNGSLRVSGKTSVGKMIDKSRYGEGLAYRDMADGALVIVIGALARRTRPAIRGLGWVSYIHRNICSYVSRPSRT